MVENKTKVTEAQLRTFLGICAKKYIKAKIEPGSFNVLCVLSQRQAPDVFSGKDRPSVLSAPNPSENQARR